MRIAQRPELTAMPIPPQSLMVYPKTYTMYLHGLEGAVVDGRTPRWTVLSQEIISENGRQWSETDDCGSLWTGVSGGGNGIRTHESAFTD